MAEIIVAQLRIGCKVKLRGSKSSDPRKPWPRGWQEVADLAPAANPNAVRVVGDERWIPVTQIEEIVL